MCNKMSLHRTLQPGAKGVADRESADHKTIKTKFRMSVPLRKIRLGGMPVIPVLGKQR